MRAPLCLWLLVSVGCTQQSPPTPAPPKALAPHAATAVVVDAGSVSPTAAHDRDVVEVEISGTCDRSKLKASSYLIYVSVEPCMPLPTSLTSLGELKPQSDASEFFIEIFPPRGSKGHVCAMALDEKGQVIALAANPKNPLAFVGEGEVEFFKIPLVLKKVKSRPKPEWKRPL